MSILPKSRVSSKLEPVEDQRLMRDWESKAKKDCEGTGQFQMEWSWYKGLPKKTRRSWSLFCDLVANGEFDRYSRTAASEPISRPPRDLSVLRGDRPFSSIRRRARRLTFPNHSDRRMRHVPRRTAPVCQVPQLPDPTSQRVPPPVLVPRIISPTVPRPIIAPEPDLRATHLDSLLCVLARGVGLPVNEFTTSGDHLDPTTRQVMLNLFSSLTKPEQAILLAVHSIIYPDRFSSPKLRHRPAIACWIRGWFKTGMHMLTKPLDIALDDLPLLHVD